MAGGVDLGGGFIDTSTDRESNASGYKGYTAEQVQAQINSAEAQGAANEGKSPEALTDDEKKRSAQVAMSQMNVNTGENDRPMYGNVTGYTQEQIDRQRQFGADAANRPAYQQDFGDYQNGLDLGSQSRDQQGSALAQQAQAADLERQAALGNAPSRAEMLGKQMADQGIASQMAMAASARGGPLAQASAMQNARNGQAAYMQHSQNQMMADRAQEMAQARSAYAQGAASYQQGATGMRQQDYSVANMGLQKTGMQTQNELAQRQMNQSAQEFYEGQANNIYSNQLQSDMGAKQLQQQQSQYDTSRSDAQTNMIVGTAAGVAGTIVGGPAVGAGAAVGATAIANGVESSNNSGGSGDSGYARGGGFNGTHPILVGEEGPEIIVPKTPGYVLTAQQTAALRGAPPTEKQAPTLAALYGSNHTVPATAPRSASLAEALAGMEHLKARISNLEGRHG